MTSRLHTAIVSPFEDNYARLVAEAVDAFSQDVVYAIQIVESARSISDKKRKTLRKNKDKP